MHTRPIKDTTAIEAYAALRSLHMPFILSGDGKDTRYSYVGADPVCIIRTTATGQVKAGTPCGPGISATDTFSALDTALSHFSAPAHTRFPFAGGAVGYFAYDLRHIADSGPGAGGWSRGARTTLDVPLSVIGIYDNVFVFDHEERQGYLVDATETEDSRERFSRLLSAITRSPRDELTPVPSPATAMRSNLTRDEYLSAVRSAKEYISAGDIYQINLSQRLDFDWHGDPFALFTKLAQTSPAPFSSMLDMGDFQVISNSPERLLRVRDGLVETSPIKGTRPRGATPEEDERLKTELRTSVKERAEHVMIVDLERNDLGRISEAGSVEVTSFEEIKTFAGLHHMVSTVRGVLKKGISAPEALRAAFPGGSITGAPKIRAMEIIDELETTSRGIYTGGIGWIGFDGSMDISMAIRTAVCAPGTLSLHVGGGIVADSVPEDEYDETILKAKSFVDLITGGAPVAEDL